jgi:hypothetical protein
MVNWTLRLKRMALAYARMWRVICGNLYGGVLLLIHIILLLLPILVVYFLILQHLNLSISFANTLFYSAITLTFPISLYLTSKIMDYMDSHNWFES